MEPIHGHGQWEAAEDIAEAIGCAPQRHASGGVGNEGRKPAMALAVHLLLPRSWAHAGPHAERVGDAHVAVQEPGGLETEADP